MLLTRNITQVSNVGDTRFDRVLEITNNVNKLTVPTYNYTTENGAQVLILNENFYDFLSSKDLVDWIKIPALIINNTNMSGE